MSRTINFTLNGEQVRADIATHQTIVEVLRDKFDLFGARESCAQGLCGCCTVLVDGKAVSGCLYLRLLSMAPRLSPSNIWRATESSASSRKPSSNAAPRNAAFARPALC